MSSRPSIVPASSAATALSMKVCRVAPETPPSIAWGTRRQMRLPTNESGGAL